MAAFPVLDFTNGPSTDHDPNVSDVEMDTYQFVNPRHTDKRYSRPHDLTISTSKPTSPSGPTTPRGFAVDSVSRRPSLAPSETSSFWKSAPSSVSSFGSFPCLTPSNANESSSRRQSVICPESQHYYLSTLSSPSDQPRKPRGIESFNDYALHDSYALSDIINRSNNSSFSTGNSTSYDEDGMYPVALDDYTDPVQSAWPSHQSSDDLSSAVCERVLQSPCFGIDLVGGFQNSALSIQERKVSPTYVNEVREISSEDLNPAQTFVAPFISNHHSATIHALRRELEYPQEDSDSDTESVGDHEMSKLIGAGRSLYHEAVAGRHSGSNQSRRRSSRCPSIFLDQPSPKRSSAKVSKGGKKSLKALPEVIGPGKRYRCSVCHLIFARPEHLQRHWRSRHEEFPELHACGVPDCVEKDKITHKKIKGRRDNLAPHYQNTHFKWGNSEKSGKNRRISLKESHELGLVQYDGRWDRFLEGRISNDKHDKDYPCVWKMLGYSITETRNTRIRQLFPERECPDDATLQQLDFRWTKMMDGSLDYATTMATGNDILVDARLGLLGMTMQETRDMGIENIEPRWIALHNGSMSIEDSEMLGVKQFNPRWTSMPEKRRR